MISQADLSAVIELLGVGFAIGAGGGVASFILASIVNTFFNVADG